MTLVALLLSLAAGFFSGALVVHPYFDGDLFWQRNLGRWVLDHHSLPTALGPEVFSAPGVPWVPQEWALGIAVATALRWHALWLLGVLCGAAASGALALAARRARAAGASALATGAAMLLALMCLYPSLGIRAQVLAWPLFAGLLVALDAGALWWVLGILVLWANLHASAVFGVVVVGLDALAWWRSDLRLEQSATRRRVLGALVAPVTLLLTPLGLRLPLYAWSLVQSPIRHYIIEWQPGYALIVPFALGFAPLCIAALSAIVPRVRQLRGNELRDAVLVVLLAIMSLYALRNLPLFGLAALPLAAVALERAVWPVKPRELVGGCLAGIVLGAAVGAYAGASQAHWSVPFATARALQAVPGEHRLFCADFAYCTAIAGDDANIRTFLDGRADPFPLWVWRDQHAIALPEPNFRAVIARDRINAVVARRESPLAVLLAQGHDWTEIPTTDACCELFVQSSRTASDNPLLVRNSQ